MIYLKGDKSLDVSSGFNNHASLSLTKILNMRKGSGILNYTLERTDTENLPIGEQRCVTKGKKVAILEFMNRRGSEITVT